VTPEALADAYFFWDPLAIAVMTVPHLLDMVTDRIEVVASNPPNLTVDGWTKRNPFARQIEYASHLTPENASLFREHVLELLSRPCIADQTLPLGDLLRHYAAAVVLNGDLQGSLTSLEIKLSIAVGLLAGLVLGLLAAFFVGRRHRHLKRSQRLVGRVVGVEAKGRSSLAIPRELACLERECGVVQVATPADGVGKGRCPPAA
jgi:hypothetical protein